MGEQIFPSVPLAIDSPHFLLSFTFHNPKSKIVGTLCKMWIIMQWFANALNIIKYSTETRYIMFNLILTVFFICLFWIWWLLVKKVGQEHVYHCVASSEKHFWGEKEQKLFKSLKWKSILFTLLYHCSRVKSLSFFVFHKCDHRQTSLVLFHFLLQSQVVGRCAECISAFEHLCIWVLDSPVPWILLSCNTNKSTPISSILPQLV